MNSEGNPVQISSVIHGLIFCDIFFLCLWPVNLFTFLIRGLTLQRGPG